MSAPIGHALHLARRFFGSLSRAQPDPVDVSWLEAALEPGERHLWEQMSPADRRHAVGVARRAHQLLGEAAEAHWLAAAALHDVGKLDSGLGTFARVAATVVSPSPVRRRSGALATRRGPLGRLGRYLQHPEIGAGLLARAGSHPGTVAWAKSHHRPEAKWDPLVPVAIGRALKEADDD